MTVTESEIEYFDCQHCERSFLDEAAVSAHHTNVHPDEAGYDFKKFKRKKKKTSGNDRAAALDHGEKMSLLKPIDEATLKAVKPDEHGLLRCPDGECERAFRDRQHLKDHAEAVHTFDDVRQILREALREKYYKPGDYNASPPKSSTWVWIEDVADDWVVFTVEDDTDTRLLKSSYVIVDETVTLGEPVEVVRRTVYLPKGTSS